MKIKHFNECNESIFSDIKNKKPVIKLRTAVIYFICLLFT